MKLMRAIGPAACTCALVCGLVGLPVPGAPLLVDGAWAQPEQPAGGGAALKEDAKQPVVGAEEQQRAEPGVEPSRRKQPVALTAAEKKRVQKASGYSADAEEAIGSFSSGKSVLSAAGERLEDEHAALLELVDQRNSLEQEILDARTSLSSAQARLDVACAEETELAKVTFFQLLFGQVSFRELAGQSVDVRQRKESCQTVCAQGEQQLARLEARRGELDAKVSSQAEEVEKTIASGNSAARELETSDSKSRMADEKAAGQVKALDAEKPQAKRAKEKIARATENHDSARVSARDALSDWYSGVNELSGARSGLIFGTGADFALSEEEFVEKWGAAIDRFYGRLGERAGSTSPLSGQGEAMARYAYEYKVDPRLCAAVSIAESSGGRHCIKPHNAWGWGAADSDPYGGAASWDSWEEAIRAWHVGMVTSTTGMAEAGSISELGEIYCSTPTWAATVSGQFAAIDACLK